MLPNLCQQHLISVCTFFDCCFCCDDGGEKYRLTVDDLALFEERSEANFSLLLLLLLSTDEANTNKSSLFKEQKMVKRIAVLGYGKLGLFTFACSAFAFAFVFLLLILFTFLFSFQGSFWWRRFEKMED